MKGLSSAKVEKLVDYIDERIKYDQRSVDNKVADYDDSIRSLRSIKNRIDMLLKGKA